MLYLKITTYYICTEYIFVTVYWYITVCTEWLYITSVFIKIFRKNPCFLSLNKKNTLKMLYNDNKRYQKFPVSYLGWYILPLVVIMCAIGCYTAMQLGWCWAILVENWPEYSNHTRNPYAEIAFRAGGNSLK